MFLSAILAAVAVTSCQKDVNEVLATGAPHTATLELSTGSKITVNQVDAKDLARIIRNR